MYLLVQQKVLVTLFKVWEARSQKHEVACVVGCEWGFINPIHWTHAPLNFALRAPDFPHFK